LVDKKYNIIYTNEDGCGDEKV